MTWQKEDIPNEDDLYMRVHRGFVRNGVPAPGVFRDHGKGMSTDWEKYSTPEQTKNRAKKPDENGVVRMNAGKVRSIPLEVDHAPVTDNRAHTEVIGDKKAPMVRVKLSRLVSWCIEI